MLLDGAHLGLGPLLGPLDADERQARRRIRGSFLRREARSDAWTVAVAEARWG